MSVGAPLVEETPVAVKPVVAAPEENTSTAIAESSDKVEPSAIATTTMGNTEGVEGTSTEQPLEGNKVAIEATPASEGVLGYKAPGFLKSFVFSKQFFWLSEEPSTSESLSGYVSNSKAEGHHHAAWAQETGKGVLFHAKRAEDKANPAGVILLADATNLTKDGTSEFSFYTGKKQQHKFEAQTTAERDSWIVAIEKAIEESKAIKDEVVGRESYKKSLSSYAAPLGAAAAVAKAERSRSKGPKKILDTTPAPVAVAEPVAAEETAAPVIADKEAEKATKKERSQSRKRASIFGILGKKDDEKEAKKEEKAEKKAEKEHEKEVKKEQKEHVKEEKKAEAEAKKEEAKATHDSSKAVEAVEAAAVAAVPAIAIAAKKKEEEEKKEEPTEAAATEKMNKRSSVFGSLFGKKNAASPAAEKAEEPAVAAPVTATEIPPVSETAPKLDEPIETKPIDTAAVTAPVDAPVVAPAHHAVTVDPEVPAETPAAPVAEAATTPKTEKKGGFLSFMKKAESKKEDKKEEKAEKKAEKDVKKELKKEEKEEAKEEKAAEKIVKDPVAAASTDSTTEPAVIEPINVVAAEERPAREKRHSSFFGSLGGKKRSTETTETDVAPVETKREKSPLPGKLGGLFRKPSKAVKSADAPVVASETPEVSKVEEPVVAATTSDPLANATIIEPTESKVIGDIVPEEFHTNLEGAAAPAEAKTEA